MPPGDLTAWIRRLYDHPGLLRMGHNQSAEDLNLGLGWVYYALARLAHPRSAVCIGSYRGFVPLVLARALQDNAEPGRVTFIDPSLLDDFWTEPDAVRAWFARLGIENVRHHRMTTQEFVASPLYEDVGEIGLLFVDGFHSVEQARFDHTAFAPRLGPRGLTLFHDSMVRRESRLYGDDRRYDMNVGGYVEELRSDPRYEVLNVPYGTGLAIVRRRPDDPADATPLGLGVEGRSGLS